MYTAKPNQQQNNTKDEPSAGEIYAKRQQLREAYTFKLDSKPQQGPKKMFDFDDGYNEIIDSERNYAQFTINDKVNRRITFDKDHDDHYPKSTINNINPEFTHLKNCKINKMFRNYNEFINLSFKSKYPTYDTNQIVKIGKLLGLKISPQQINHENFQKKIKEFVCPLKEKLLNIIWSGLNQGGSEREQPQKINNFSSYKFFIGKGNNSSFIKTVVKQRWWWYDHDKEDMKEVHFIWTQWRKNNILDDIKQIQESCDDESNENSEDSSVEAYPVTTSHETKLYNRIEDNYHLSDKKALFINMKKYYDKLNLDVFDYLPTTFHIKDLDDPQFQNFKDYFLETNQKCVSDEEEKNIWIIKPGENTNRGIGITVMDSIEDIESYIVDLAKDEKHHTCIVQKYLHNALLIKKRKFDIRVFTLVTCVNGKMRGYFYEEGYLRTSC